MCDPGEGHTPVTQQKPPEAEPVTPPATLRYVFSDGKVSGVATHNATFVIPTTYSVVSSDQKSVFAVTDVTNHGMFLCVLLLLLCDLLQPVGIANTTNKYSESRPVRAHVTPFEKRLERKIAEETEAIAIVSSDIKQPSDTQ